MSTILVEHGLVVGPFSEGILQEMPTNTWDDPWVMEEEEMGRRRDLRYVLLSTLWETSTNEAWSHLLSYSAVLCPQALIYLLPWKTGKKEVLCIYFFFWYFIKNNYSWVIVYVPRETSWLLQNNPLTVSGRRTSSSVSIQKVARMSMTRYPCDIFPTVTLNSVCISLM